MVIMGMKEDGLGGYAVQQVAFVRWRALLLKE